MESTADVKAFLELPDGGYGLIGGFGEGEHGVRLALIQVRRVEVDPEVRLSPDEPEDGGPR